MRVAFVAGSILSPYQKPARLKTTQFVKNLQGAAPPSAMRFLLNGNIRLSRGTCIAPKTALTSLVFQRTADWAVSVPLQCGEGTDGALSALLSALPMALHQTIRGKTETVTPVEADCVASPIVRRTSGFLQGIDVGQAPSRREGRYRCDRFRGSASADQSLLMCPFRQTHSYPHSLGRWR
jgi:hypothetical protein